MRRLYFPRYLLTAAALVVATSAASGASTLIPVAAGNVLVAPGNAFAAPGSDGLLHLGFNSDPSVHRSAAPVPVGGTPESTPPQTSSAPSTVDPAQQSATVPPTADPTTTKPAIRNLVVSGHGYGHGRGLGQWGAYGYAVEKGWDYRRILDHYYGNTSVGKLSPTSAIGVRLLSQDGKQVAIYQSTGRFYLTVNGETFGPDAASLPAASAGSAPAAGVPAESASTKPGPVAVGLPPATIPSSPQADSGSTGNGGVSTVATTTPPLIAPSGIAPGAPAVVRIQLVSAGRFAISEATSCAGPWNLRATVSAASVTVSTGQADVTEPAAMLQVCTSNGRRAYRGDLAAVDGKPGQYLVNQVNMEEYLRGVLPAEVPSGWGAKPNGMEALKAQAVAARSYAAAEKRPGLANTCDTTACQVYAGRGEFRGGAFVSFEDSRADDAIEATANEVRFDKTGAVVRTEYSSSTGGQSAPGVFPPVVDDGDRTTANPHANWSVTLTAARLEAGRKLGAFKDLVVTLRDGVGPYGGRVQNLDLVFERGKVSYKSGEFLRLYNLRSTLFNPQIAESGGGSSGTGGVPAPLEAIPDDGTSGFVGVALPNQNKSIESVESPTTTAAAKKSSGKSATNTTVAAKKNSKTVATVVVTPVAVGKKAQQAIPVASAPPTTQPTIKSAAKSVSKANTTKRAGSAKTTPTTKKP